MLIQEKCRNLRKVKNEWERWANPKSEYLNPKQILNSNVLNPKPLNSSLLNSKHVLVIWILIFDIV